MAEQRRAPGRPPTHKDGEIRKLLISVAAEEFLASGYEQTRVKTLAEKAGISTRTFYKFIPNKAELFRMVAEDWLQKELQTLERRPQPEDTNKQELARLVLLYTRLLLSPTAKRTAVIIMREMERFPEILENYQTAVERLAHAFDTRIVHLCSKSDIDCPNPTEAAVMLRTMISGLQRQSMMRWQEDMTEQDIIRWADHCTRFFLEGCKGL
ncbi:transcriptional regulator, TetR family [Cohaesibacter sp. ES.047]|uniref:TetR/AcrR family transcriptional regulator n=1 Tax=Cohaesibacter sp. ES.047 TaxID=1798205 RepID=UPI000BB9BD58|nr:TetR/AcrR family transcriptional regulator [Cohaesibacter sp. ES.047]SNY92258.1 transcriptional regulator, TetR family [Cohaesibacter sp. ES.047]